MINFERQLTNQFILNPISGVDELDSLNGSELVDRFKVYLLFSQRGLSNNENSESIFNLLNSLLKVAEEKGQLHLFTSLLTIATNHPACSPTNQIHYYNRIGQSFRNQQALDSAEQQHSKALTLAKKNNLPFYIAESKYYLAECLHASGVDDKALDLALEAIEMLKAQSNPLYLLASCFNLIGLIKTDQNLLDDSINNFKVAIEVWESLDESVEQARSMKNLGRSHSLQGAYSTSIEIFNNALQLAKNNTVEKSEILNCLGAAQVSVGEYLSASITFTKAEEMLRYIDSKPHLKTEIIHNLGVLELKKSDYAKSIRYLEKALIKWDATGQEVNKARVYGLLGEIHLLNNRFEQSLPYYEKAISIVNNNPHESTFLFELQTELEIAKSKMRA